MSAENNERRPGPRELGIRDRINQAILSQYARGQSYAAATPRLVADPSRPQRRRMRCVRWAVNITMSTGAAAAISLTTAWGLRTQHPSEAPDITQSATIIIIAAAAWCAAETLRMLLPREFDMGEKASFGHRWRPSPDQPAAAQYPDLAHRALKQSYGLAAAAVTALTALLSLELPYAWPAAGPIIAAIGAEYRFGRSNSQGEWQSLTDRISGIRHCMKRPEPKPPAPLRPGPGGGTRGSRRKRSQQRRRASRGNGAKS